MKLELNVSELSAAINSIDQKLGNVQVVYSDLSPRLKALEESVAELGTKLTAINSAIASIGVQPPAEQEQPQPAISTAPVAPPPASSTAQQSGVMSLAEKQNVINQSTGMNVYKLVGWTGGIVDGHQTRANGNWGQWRGAAGAIGGRLYWMPQDQDWWSASWAVKDRAKFDRRKNDPFDTLEPWFVAAEAEGNTAPHGSVKVDVRNIRLLVLRKGKTKWETLLRTNEVTWANAFAYDMGSPGANIAVAKGSNYSTTMVPTNGLRVNHFGTYQAEITSIAPDIESVMVSAEVRLNPDTPEGAKIGFQIGADPKWNNDRDFMRAYVGVGLSRIEPVTREWKRHYYCPLVGAQDILAYRAITQERFLATEVPIADL